MTNEIYEKDYITSNSKLINDKIIITLFQFYNTIILGLQ
jgi:hypothetical protein